MKRISKPIGWLLALACLMAMVLCPIPSGAPARAADSVNNLFQKLPDSTPGNFTVTWYSAKRYFPGRDPGAANPGGRFYATHIGVPGGPVDKDKSDAALQSWDTSVPLKTDTIPDLTFDMKNWQPDAEYQDMSEEPKYNWNWCEVDGFIKVDSVRSDASIFFDPFFKGRSDITFDLKINPDNGYRDKTAFANAQFLPFRLRIKCYEPDKSILNPTFSAPGFVWGYLSKNVSGVCGRLPAGNIYGTLALKDMQSLFQLDAPNYTLILDSQYSTLPVGDYEYGYAGGTDFKPLALGANYLEPANGDVIVRYKSRPNPYITIGAVTLQPTGYLSITGRTPTTASLAWVPPSGSEAPAGYEIYRQKIGWMSGLSFNIHFIDNTFNTVEKVGSTSGLTFTDQGLSCNFIYAYYVKINYSAGNSAASNTVRTDFVAMTGLPSTPDKLEFEVEAVNWTPVLKLRWTSSSSPAGIKEYVVYRKIERVSKSTERPDGTIILDGKLSYPEPVEIARMSGATYYIDCDVDAGDQCGYYVQAIDNNGVPSLCSAPLNVTVPDVEPPFKVLPNKMETYIGITQPVTVHFDSGYTGDKTGTWSVADSSVVSVEENNTEPVTINSKHTIPGSIGAKVTGLKTGITTVTFTNTETGTQGKCAVTVSPAFTIAPDPLTVYEGETGSLAINYDDGYTGSKAGMWRIDDSAVASIDQNGTVAGKKAGIAVVSYTVIPLGASSGGETGDSAGTGTGTGTGAGAGLGVSGGTVVSVAAPTTASAAYNRVRTVTVVVKPQNYTVTFDAQGGSPAPASVSVKHDTAVTKPDDPSRSNATFCGWYTEPDGSRQWDFTNDKVTEDMTLYAQWAVKVIPSSSEFDGHSSVRIAPTITGPDSIDLAVGYLNTDQVYTVSGTPVPTLTITANTAGATLSGNTLTIPAGLGAGSYSVTLEASSSVETVSKTVTVNITSALTAPAITGPDIDLIVGYLNTDQAYTVSGTPVPTLTITANTAGATLSSNTLTIPAGLDAGSYTVTLTASNTAGTVIRTVNVIVSPAETLPTIDGPETISLMVSTLTGVSGEVYRTYTFGGVPAPTCTITTNTAGAALTGNTLTIPAGLNTGSYTIALTASNASGTATKTIGVNVYPLIMAGFTDIYFSLADYSIAGLNINEASGGAGGPYTFTSTGMPAGLVLSSEGTITGTTAEGEYSGVPLTITDSVENSRTINVLLRVQP